MESMVSQRAVKQEWRTRSALIKRRDACKRSIGMEGGMAWEVG